MPGHGRATAVRRTAGTTLGPTRPRSGPRRVRFRRALALMAMTLVLPGCAAAGVRQPRVGLAALRIWFALLLVGAGCLVVAALHHEFAFWLVSDLAALQTVRFALMALAVAWAALFFDAWRLGQPLTLRMSHRRAAVGINGILCFSVAAVLLFGAHLVGVQRDFIQTMFGSGDASPARTTAATTCCCSAATPAWTAGGCVRTRSPSPASTRRPAGPCWSRCRATCRTSPSPRVR